MTHRSLSLAALACSLSLVSWEASAQDANAQSAAEVERTLACVRAPHDDIVQWIRLLNEAKATLTSRSASEAARRDARESIVVLGQRLRESAAALGACGEAPRPEARTTPREAPREATLSPVSVHVRSAAPRVVSGAGRVDPVEIHESLLRLGSGLDACYEALTERRASESGDAHLVFSLIGREVRALVLEGLRIGDPLFAQCVGRMVRGLHVARGATGGEVRVDVVLHFGPE